MWCGGIDPSGGLMPPIIAAAMAAMSGAPGCRTPGGKWKGGGRPEGGGREEGGMEEAGGACKSGCLEVDTALSRASTPGVARPSEALSSPPALVLSSVFEPSSAADIGWSV